MESPVSLKFKMALAASSKTSPGNILGPALKLCIIFYNCRKSRNLQHFVGCWRLTVGCWPVFKISLANRQQPTFNCNPSPVLSRFSIPDSDAHILFVRIRKDYPARDGPAGAVRHLPRLYTSRRRRQKWTGASVAQSYDLTRFNIRLHSRWNIVSQFFRGALRMRISDPA